MPAPCPQGHGGLGVTLDRCGVEPVRARVFFAFEICAPVRGNWRSQYDHSPTCSVELSRHHGSLHLRLPPLRGHGDLSVTLHCIVGLSCRYCRCVNVTPVWRCGDLSLTFLT
jgi:hypothetical protein